MIKIRFIYLSLLFVVFTTKAPALTLRQNPDIKQVQRDISMQKTDTVCRIIKANENTYGYEILINDKVIIRQLTIPGRQGTTGFKKKTDAEKVAKLAVQKIKQGMMPPTIKQNELEELKISF